MVDAGEVSRYAGLMLAEVHADMAGPFPWGSQIPRDVGSFAALHDYCDANGYVLSVMPDHALAFDDDAACELVNAVLDEVSRRLACEAARVCAGLLETAGGEVTVSVLWNVRVAGVLVAQVMLRESQVSALQAAVAGSELRRAAWEEGTL